MRGELSTTEKALERATTDADGLRAALGAQRASREQTERTAAALRKRVAEERAGFMQTRGELAAATAARRHTESQASLYTGDMFLGYAMRSFKAVTETKKLIN